MKTIRISFFALACFILTANFAIAIEPEKQNIEKEKILLLKKIRRSVSKIDFVDFIEAGNSEVIVLRCTINENNRVVVSKVIGFDDELKQAVRKAMDNKMITASSGLVGEELALRFKFALRK